MRRELEQIRTQIDEDKLQMLTKINKQESAMHDLKVNLTGKLDALQLTTSQQHEETRAAAVAATITAGVAAKEQAASHTQVMVQMSLMMNAIQGQNVQTQETQPSNVRSSECTTVSLGQDSPQIIHEEYSTQASDALDSVMQEPASSVKRPFFSSVDSADQPSKQKGGRGQVKSTSVSQGPIFQVKGPDATYYPMDVQQSQS